MLQVSYLCFNTAFRPPNTAHAVAASVAWLQKRQQTLQGTGKQAQPVMIAGAAWLASLKPKPSGAKHCAALAEVPAYIMHAAGSFTMHACQSTLAAKSQPMHRNVATRSRIGQVLSGVVCLLITWMVYCAWVHKTARLSCPTCAVHRRMGVTNPRCTSTLRAVSTGPTHAARHASTRSVSTHTHTLFVRYGDTCPVRTRTR